jgi:hypothetical protein
MKFTNKFQVDQNVEFKYHSWTETLVGKIIATDHYKDVDNKQVDLYIIKELYGNREHRIFESEIKKVV